MAMVGPKWLVPFSFLVASIDRPAMQKSIKGKYIQDQRIKREFSNKSETRFAFFSVKLNILYRFQLH
jgi:hypothetical protein